DTRLVDIGNAFAHDASPHIALFDAHGTPAAVINGLPDRIAALAAAIQHQRDGRNDVTTSVVSVTASTARLRRIIKGLDAVVMSRPRRNPAVAAVWEKARRVGPAKPAPAATAAESDPSKAPAA